MATIDEMKKFNTRRRLIGAVLNAASSPKWALYNNDSLCDVDQFSDFNSDEGTSKGLSLELSYVYILDSFS